jgi:hypothetical protein
MYIYIAKMAVSHTDQRVIAWIEDIITEHGAKLNECV